MEEKVLIKSKRYDVKKIIKKMLIIGIVLFVLGSICFISKNSAYYNDCYGADHEHDSWCYKYIMDCPHLEYDNAFSYALSEYFPYQFTLLLIPVAAIALIGGLIYLVLSNCELTVTDKRVCGKVGKVWKKRVDLPIDSVSAIATKRRLFKGVSISTSSGRISFGAIKNADEIYEVMSNLLIERQQEKVNATVAATAPKSDEADQLKKFKDLLDSGVITQEEFDVKKKQLLGL